MFTFGDMTAFIDFISDPEAIASCRLELRPEVDVQRHDKASSVGSVVGWGIDLRRSESASNQSGVRAVPPASLATPHHRVYFTPSLPASWQLCALSPLWESLPSPLTMMRTLLRPLYCRAGCKRSRPCGFLETPPRDLGGVRVCRPLFCKDLAKGSMWGRVSGRAEVITDGRGRGRQKRPLGPKVSPSLCFAGYGVMRGLSPL